HNAVPFGLQERKSANQKSRICHNISCFFRGYLLILRGLAVLIGQAQHTAACCNVPFLLCKLYKVSFLNIEVILYSFSEKATFFTVALRKSAFSRFFILVYSFLLQL
ncbi:hypothetical protein, partial [Ruminococcus champanellensis]|uniref:hypothetical protein n=1 Tax=Ruminococcus champanellensis TaxID=1161942 RepID=UPI0023F1FE1D